MADWEVGDLYPATSMSRRMINAQLSPLFLSANSQDIIDDLVKYKERALNTHILKIMPKFMLKTPGMKRRAKAIDTLLERIQSVHTPAQRADSPRDLADDILSLHASDPQFLPESNLRFALSAALIASVYLGDAFSSPGYAPYGLGIHTCLGFRLMELQLAGNVLMVAHYFNIKVFPQNYKIRFSPLPSMKPSKNLKFDIIEQRREIRV